MKFCLVNGVQQSHIDIENRGLAYGDGLFTTAKILNGKIQYISAHVDRLLSGCKKLGISAPKSSELSQQLLDIAQGYSLAVLKVIITAKSGGRGYARSKDNGHDVIIMVHDYPTLYDQQANSGITLGISKQQLGINPMLNGLKHLNRLEQVLLRKELSDLVVDDLVATNVKGNVIEAVSANLFCYIDQVWQTPDVSQSGVNGIMRQAVLKTIPDSKVSQLTLEHLKKSQSIFTCNSVMGIMPIRQFDGKELSIEQALLIRELMLEDVHDA